MLDNKNVVVYGAGGAVGAAVSRAFARDGARVFLAGRTHAKVERVASEIRRAGGAAEARGVDALDERAVEGHVAGVVASAGGIDVLFNAIGLDDVQGIPLLDLWPADLVYPVVAGLRSHLLTARAVARRMVGRGSGAILTITAVPHPEGRPNVGGFDVACAAIEGLWRTLAAELGPRGLRFGVLRSPGSPDTPGVQEVLAMHAEASGSSVEQYRERPENRAWLQRLPGIGVVADAAVRLAVDLDSGGAEAFAIVTCPPGPDPRAHAPGRTPAGRPRAGSGFEARA